MPQLSFRGFGLIGFRLEGRACVCCCLSNPPAPQNVGTCSSSTAAPFSEATSCQFQVRAEKLGVSFRRSDDGRSGLALARGSGSLCCVRSKVWNQVCQLPYPSLLRHRRCRQTSHEVRLQMLLLHISCRAKNQVPTAMRHSLHPSATCAAYCSAQLHLLF